MKTVILGSGFSGLACGITSGGTIYEATENPGGLGHEYEINGFRFSRAGGHWLFSQDALVTAFIKGLCDIKRYERKSSIYFPDEDRFYPYPIQSTPEFADIIQRETADAASFPALSMRGELQRRFGQTMCEKFFFPFNDLYTAGLMDSVTPQDSYKSPPIGNKGYNETFIYPTKGLGHLAKRMAARCDVRFGKRAKRIDVKEKIVYFEDGSSEKYEKLVSTLPLNKTLEMAGLSAGRPDPCVSVSVLNIAAEKGSRCPDLHWAYTPHDWKDKYYFRPFHRVGFYSNVDKLFLPAAKKDSHVSIYIENAHLPNEDFDLDYEQYRDGSIKLLQDWGWIKDVEVCDPTWVDVAYTYRNIGSTWREDSIKLLGSHDILCVGRYSEWRFCGIVESMRRGFEVGIKL